MARVFAFKVLAVLGLVFVPVGAMADEGSDTALRLITLLEECEEGFREKDWQEASENIATAQSLFQGNFHQWAQEVNEGGAGRDKLVKNISAILGSLEKSIAEENHIKAESRHRSVTKYLFELFQALDRTEIIVEKFRLDVGQLQMHFEDKNARDLRTEANEILYSLKRIEESNAELADQIPIDIVVVESLLEELRAKNFDQAGQYLNAMAANF